MSQMKKGNEIFSQEVKIFDPMMIYGPKFKIQK